MANKTYGLSFPTRKAAETEKKRIESVFAAEESEDEEEDQSKLKPLPTVQPGHVHQARIHRKTKSDYEKAMEEDPSVFQYDEIYDEIKNEKEREIDSIFGTKEKQSKYVGRLIKTAKERKLERELCLERKAQKELESEQSMYGQKESFVTSAYKSKLNELQELIDKREAEEQVEKFMDITTQDGLGGFYRYMYQHETGKPEGDAKQSLDQSEQDSNKTSADSVVPLDKPVHPKPSQPETPARSDSQSSQPRSSQASTRNDEPSRHDPHRHSDSSSSNSAPRSGSPKQYTKHRQSPDSVHRGHGSRSTSPVEQKPPARQDPNFLYAKPRATTDAQIAEARDRFLQRKSDGIHAVIAESDSEDE